MSTFDPERPCRVHDVLDDKTINWKTAWAQKWRESAWMESDGIAYFQGLMLDGWAPMA